MISINTQNVIKKIPNFWNNIHFHPTDAIEDAWGQRILNEVKKDHVADMVRMYTMLEDIVSMDEDGNLQYDFTLNDQRLDYMIAKGFNILLCYNFIPACLAVNPEIQFASAKNKTRYKGKMVIASRPKDYVVWEEICYRYTAHIVERYGEDVVAKWYLHCFNEPDLPSYFMGELPRDEESAIKRLPEYIKLYRHFTRGVYRASEKLTVGGPSAAMLTPFFEGFLKAAKEEELPLDFVSIHTYGVSVRQLLEGTKPFYAENTLMKYKLYFEIVEKYFPGIKMIVDEWGASSGGFADRDRCPALLFREGSEYAAYMGKMVAAYIRDGVSPYKMMICLSGQHEMTTDFSGFRNFFSLNFIKKPIYNAFVLMRKLGENLVTCESGDGDLSVLATQDGAKTAIMLAYASKNFDCVLPTLFETIKLTGLSGKKTVRIWRIDDTHTNPYKLSLREGWNENFTKEQIVLLQREATLVAEEWEIDFDVTDSFSVELINNALVMIEVE